MKKLLLISKTLLMCAIFASLATGCTTGGSHSGSAGGVGTIGTGSSCGH